MINSSSSQLFPNFYVLLVPLLVSSFAALFSFILLSSFLILFAGMSQFRVAILYSCACMSCMTVIHPSKHVSFISICAWLHKAEIHPVCHHPAHTNQWDHLLPSSRLSRPVSSLVNHCLHLTSLSSFSFSHIDGQGQSFSWWSAEAQVWCWFWRPNSDCCQDDPSVLYTRSQNNQILRNYQHVSHKRDHIFAGGEAKKWGWQQIIANDCNF